MSFVQFWCWESWMNLCCLLFPCIVTLSRFKNLYSQTIQSLIPQSWFMDGHPFQIEQNIRPSRNFEPWKLTEPHLLVPNSKVEGVCFGEGSFGLLSTPSAPDFTPLSAFLCPQKSRNQLAFVCTSAPFSISCFWRLFGILGLLHTTWCWLPNKRGCKNDYTLLTKQKRTQWWFWISFAILRLSSNLGRKITIQVAYATVLVATWSTAWRSCFLSSFMKFLSAVSEEKSKMSRQIWGQGGDLVSPIGPKNTNLVEHIEILLPVKFLPIRFSGLRGEVKNVSVNQRPGRPSWFSDRPEKHKLGRAYWDLASSQVSSNSL